MRCSSASAFAALFLLAPTSLGTPVSIRVRGAAKIVAKAAAVDDQATLSGTLLDDTGRPVGGATLRVRGVDVQGATFPLPAFVPCSEALGGHDGARRSEQTLKTDAAGRFCGGVEATGAGAFEVSFNDERGLLDAAEAKVAIDPARGAVELRLVPATPTFELERERQRVSVSSHGTATRNGSLAPLPLALYARGPTEETLVAQGACPLGGDAELEVPTSKLQGAGPVELTLRFAGTSALQPAEATRRVLATARVNLTLTRAPDPADPTDGITIDVALGSAAGAVQSGSLEATLDGHTVGIGNVQRGAARVLARFARRGPSARLALRYLPTEPWWRPGPALEVDVTLASSGRWTSTLWLAGLAAMAAWLLRGWRRPARVERARPAPDDVRPQVAGVQLIRRDDAYIGWRGIIRDAHDEKPVPGALVSLVGRDAERRVLARTTADASGCFELWSAEGGALDLLVTASWHSDFTSPAPPHGELRIDLVSRRRYLLGRLVRWAERRSPFNRERTEPTPGDVKRLGRKTRKDDVVEWATLVENAAYGPGPVDETIEHEVSRHEPVDPDGGRTPGR